MKMNKQKLSKTNAGITRPIFNLLILLIFISTCSKNPTEGNNNGNTNSGLSIRYEISIGEQIQNNVIVPVDTITAFITSSGLPAVEKYVTFNRITNEQSTLTPMFAITDSMGVAKSVYKLVYSGELSSDTVSAKIVIGAGNDANSITAHDTVGLVYVLRAVDPLSAIEYFNFYPGGNSNWAKYASEDLEVKVLARNIAGVGVCNVPIRFRLLGNVNSPPNGVIESEYKNTCELNNSEGESENNNIVGEASIIYKSDGAGIDTLIASIVDPSNDTLFLFADTIKIQTIGSTLLIDDVVSISSNAGIANIIISNADSIKTNTIFARALDVNGALISGIPFQFSISEDVGGYSGLTLSDINSSIYLSVGGLSISDSLGVAYQILTIDPNIFPTLGNLLSSSLESIQLSISINIPSTDKSSSVDVNILNNIPTWYPNSAKLILSSETYILPCVSCTNETSAIITATLKDSLINEPPPGTIIEFSSLQKDTTGLSGEDEGFQWKAIGNIAPGTIFNSNGEATVDFHMENDRGIAYIIGTVGNYDISDTIQIIIETTDASHINILPPDQDKIMVQGGGGIEYSEIFVQITDNTGNIVYDNPYQVQFELTGSPTGTTLENSADPIVKVAESGETSVTIVSGTAPGSVHLTVSLYEELDEITIADPIAIAATIPLTIVTGPPEYGEINFSNAEWAPVPTSGVVEYPLSVYLEDLHSNPVADSMAIYFKLRENADKYDTDTDYNYGDKVTWLEPGSVPTPTVLDSIVYVCIDQEFNCLSGGTDPGEPTKWWPSVHPAEIVGHGETGMENPIDLESYPGIAYSSIFFGPNSTGSNIIVFAQTYSGADNSIFIVDSRTNHAGDGINLPCLGCTIELVANPTNWDFSLPPFDTGEDNVDVMSVTVTATLRNSFGIPLYNLPIRIVAEGIMPFPNGNLYACNGEDTDLDGSTGVCQHAVTGTPHSPLVADCWTCVNDFSPTFIWVSDTGDDLELARTSTQGKARWIVQYSELINFPLTGTSPNATWTNQTVTISVDLDGIIAFPEIENTTVDININKTERD